MRILTLVTVFLAFLSIPVPAFAAGNPANGSQRVYTLNTASTNLPSTYGAAANLIASGLSGKSHICVLNGTTTKLYGAFSTASNCTGASYDNIVVPANASGGTGGTACFDGMQTNSYFCLRANTGTVSSGVIDTTIR